MTAALAWRIAHYSSATPLAASWTFSSSCTVSVCYFASVALIMNLIMSLIRAPHARSAAQGCQGPCRNHVLVTTVGPALDLCLMHHKIPNYTQRRCCGQYWIYIKTGAQAARLIYKLTSRLRTEVPCHTSRAPPAGIEPSSLDSVDTCHRLLLYQDSTSYPYHISIQISA